jgi:dCMP deaminase
MNHKPDDEKYMEMAEAIAFQSTCKRRKHGAAIVNCFGVLALGVNHSPDMEPCQICIREKENIPSGTQYEKCRAIHAEQDAICLAARIGDRLDGTTLYITGCPCMICARMIVVAGIKRVVIGFREPHRVEGVIELLKENGVKVREMNEERKVRCGMCSNDSQRGSEDCEGCADRSPEAAIKKMGMWA